MDEWNKTTYTLAKFAEYSNIGGNRKGGFGVVQFRERKRDIKPLGMTYLINPFYVYGTRFFIIYLV